MAQTRPSPTLSRGFTRLGRFLAPYGTHQMFGEWFDLQMCPVVEDLHLDEELVELD